MPHVAIVGMTTSGKTTLGVSLAREYQRNHFATLVCDPKNNPAWHATWSTVDLGKLRSKALACRRCALFIEEAGDFSKHPDLEWFFTQARNWGHVTHYLSQFHRQVPPIVRGNIETCFLFKAGRRCVMEFAEEFGEEADEIRRAVKALARYQFLRLARYEPPRPCILAAADVRRLGV